MTTAAAPAPSRVLNISLWVVQVLLAGMFGLAAIMKLSTPTAGLVEAGMAWAGRLPEGAAKFIGSAELLGAIGMILPAALRIRPTLTGWAGVGLATIMVLAMAEHSMSGEYDPLPINMVLGGLAAFVAWGRLSAARIAPR